MVVVNTNIASLRSSGLCVMPQTRWEMMQRLSTGLRINSD